MAAQVDPSTPVPDGRLVTIRWDDHWAIWHVLNEDYSYCCANDTDGRHLVTDVRYGWEPVNRSTIEIWSEDDTAAALGAMALMPDWLPEGYEHDQT